MKTVRMTPFMAQGYIGVDKQNITIPFTSVTDAEFYLNVLYEFVTKNNMPLRITLFSLNPLEVISVFEINLKGVCDE